MDDIVSDDELREQFPLNEDSEYSGKCEYCSVNVNFSNQTQVKIIPRKNKETKELLVYHKTCYDRYLRRTID